MIGRVALVPLDERPVNTSLVAEVAAIAGAECVLPDAALLPRFRTAGDTDGLAEWLRAVAGSVDAIVVAIDTLAFGGLIPARTSDDTVETAVGRLGLLRELATGSPGRPVYAVSLVTRASDSYSASEEPDYWVRYGRGLHRLGRDAHRAWADRGRSVPSEVPPTVRADFVRRRLRNHVVNLAALELQWNGVLTHLALTADDTAEFSAGSAEQEWFGYWQGLAGPGLPVVSYPGADETGAVLMARALLAGAGRPPSVRIRVADPESLERVPLYENRPLRESIAGQLTAAGAVQTESDDADLVLVVHGPDPARGDHFALMPPAPSSEAAEATAEVVERCLEAGTPVALADLRYGNGGDAGLVEALGCRGLLQHLAAYAGWNTAGNALGSVIAMGLAGVAGERGGNGDRRAQSVALRRRLLDDVAYQAVVRRELMTGVFAGSIDPVADDVLAAAAVRARDRLTALLAGWGLGDGPAIDAVGFPWRRSFEIDIGFAQVVPEASSSR